MGVACIIVRHKEALETTLADKNGVEYAIDKALQIRGITQQRLLVTRSLAERLDDDTLSVEKTVLDDSTLDHWCDSPGKIKATLQACHRLYDVDKEGVLLLDASFPLLTLPSCQGCWTTANRRKAIAVAASPNPGSLLVHQKEPVNDTGWMLFSGVAVIPREKHATSDIYVPTLPFESLLNNTPVMSRFVKQVESAGYLF